MADVLRIGTNTLLSLQRAMATTGHNISNVNTEGYSRQSVEFETREATRLGVGFMGNGSVMAGVTRSHDSFLTAQVREYTASKSNYESFLSMTSRLDDMLADTDSGLNVSLQRFFDSMQDLSANPSGIPERQALLGEAKNLVMREQKLHDAMASLGQEVGTQLESIVSEVNSMAKSISQLNKQIASASGAGQTPNDLLDERDRLVRQLSEKVAVTQVDQPDGSVDIYIGKGQGLVVGSSIATLETVRDNALGGQLEVAMQAPGGSQVITQYLSGGELQGLVDFRSRVLKPAQEQLGLVSLGLSEAMNAQHRLGMDLEGNMGGAFFKDIAVSVAARSGNTGSADPVVALDDVGQVRASDYRVDYDGAQWNLTRLSDNTSVSGAGPLTLDGMTVDFSSGTPAAGDSFRFNPALDALENFELLLGDPRKIAAAAPVAASADPDNAGTAALSGLAPEAANTLPLGGDITLTFNPDALGAGVPGFDVSGGGSIAYDPASESEGKQFTLTPPGIGFTLSGVPADGDSFVLASNAGATGDNSNILKMAALQDEEVMEGGNSSFGDVYGSMVSKVGISARDAGTNLKVESTLLQEAQKYKESVSGVNLDEEAANLLKFQQVYQAAARLVKVSEDMFQTLMQSMG